MNKIKIELNKGKVNYGDILERYERTTIEERDVTYGLYVYGEGVQVGVTRGVQDSTDSWIDTDIKVVLVNETRNKSLRDRGVTGERLVRSIDIGEIDIVYKITEVGEEVTRKTELERLDKEIKEIIKRDVDD